MSKGDNQKTGIELIAEERKEQIYKHGRTIQQDVRCNKDYQLVKGACALLSTPDQEHEATADLIWELGLKKSWNKKIFMKMVGKSYKERLVIAGALIAAEIDRLQNQKS